MNSHYKKLDEVEAQCWENWELLIEKFAEKKAIESSLPILKEFENSWIKIDAIICRLNSVNPVTAWASVYWPTYNWMSFPLGLYVNIYIPGI